MYSATITFEIDCTVISNKYGFKIEKMTPKFITGIILLIMYTNAQKMMYNHFNYKCLKSIQTN